jgi:hypothetical protein
MGNAGGFPEQRQTPMSASQSRECRGGQSPIQTRPIVRLSLVNNNNCVEGWVLVMVSIRRSLDGSQIAIRSFGIEVDGFHRSNDHALWSIHKTNGRP